MSAPGGWWPRCRRLASITSPTQVPALVRSYQLVDIPRAGRAILSPVRRRCTPPTAELAVVQALVARYGLLLLGDWLTRLTERTWTLTEWMEAADAVDGLGHGYVVSVGCAPARECRRRDMNDLVSYRRSAPSVLRRSHAEAIDVGVLRQAPRPRTDGVATPGVRNRARRSSCHVVWETGRDDLGLRLPCWTCRPWVMRRPLGVYSAMRRTSDMGCRSFVVVALRLDGPCVSSVIRVLQRFEQVAAQ